MGFRSLGTIALLLGWAATQAAAQQRGVSVVNALSGYQCMDLNVPAGDLDDLARMPAVLSEPRADAPRIGVASATMIATAPLRTTNGYTQVLHLDGRQGWIESAKLRRWGRPQVPAATCTPARLSNGRIGFDIGPH